MIRRIDRIKKVYVQASPSEAPSSLIQYCDDNDVVKEIDATGLHDSAGNIYKVKFPTGATKAYISSATGTAKIYK